MFHDFLLENCTCYFWERRLLASGVGLAIGITIWLICDAFTKYDPIIIGLTAGLSGVVSGTICYVLSSESYCHIESLFGMNETKTSPYMGDVDPNLG